MTNLPKSGPWSGYYAYGSGERKHRMQLHLAFYLNGLVEGDGIDGIAPFTIRGSFDPATCGVEFRKQYVRMHNVEYSGVFDGRNILGTWNLPSMTGPFRIWPGSLSDDVEISEGIEVDVPDAVTQSVSK